MKNTFDRHISKLDITKERISELEDNIQQKFPKFKCKEKIELKREQNMQEENNQRVQYIFVMTIPERKERNKKYLK